MISKGDFSPETANLVRQFLSHSEVIKTQNRDRENFHPLIISEVEFKVPSLWRLNFNEQYV